ncbi:hypothetical protein C0995_009105 [Termitomyces sp. Mi166|nr:hypothetical protein C0995_009105 [Termitomyces sp. Mi166\
MSLIWLLIESGAIYTSAAIIQLITEVLGMNAGVIMELMLAQICAIAPGLIVVRIALGSAFGSPFKKNKSSANAVQLTTFHATANHVKSIDDTLGSHTLPGTISLEEHTSHSRIRQDAF